MLAASTCLLYSATSNGSNVRYVYLATVNSDGSGLFYASGETLAGSFEYDNAATSLISPSPTIYAAVANLTGSIGGDSFSDPAGFAGAWNDSFGPGGSADAFTLSADGPNVVTLSGFQLTDGTNTYDLTNVYFRWIGTGFLNDESLPATLPPTSGGGIALEFTNIADSNDTFEVLSGLNSLTPIPAPAAVWLFGSALGLLGWIRRGTC